MTTTVTLLSTDVVSGQGEVESTFTIAKGSLWKRLGIEKLSIIIGASKTDPVIETLLLMISDSEYINLKDLEFLKGLDILKAKNLISQMDIDKIKQPAQGYELPGV